MKYLILIAFLLSLPAHAEPGNAPDTKGNFVLVVAGTASSFASSCPMLGGCGSNKPHTETQYRIQPFTITGFKSFKMCTGAGRELQARLNTDGYTLDFSCVAVSR